MTTNAHLPSIKIFADGANIAFMKAAFHEGLVKGFTTNPTLLKKSGVTNYAAFVREVLMEITSLPISFEVLSDDFVDMEREARMIASWGANVFVKIPITNTRGESSLPLIQGLSRDGLKINVTAILTPKQVQDAIKALPQQGQHIISIFAGRIADTGVDPIPIVADAVSLVKGKSGIEILWASPRELFNLFQAASAGCHIITLSDDLLKKLPSLGKDLGEVSLETVRMFFHDANAAGLTL